MANFFLIDQSLNRLGGHHYDYVRCVAQAAQSDGYLTTIGTHRQFRSAEGLAKFGQIRESFRNNTYQADSYLTGLRHLTRSGDRFLNSHQYPGGSWRRFWSTLRQGRHRLRREKLIREFAKDCERFFQPAMMTDRDHAFFTTINEIELMGLAAYLANHPRTLQVQWHLQFHFNLFDGRPPEYQSQQLVARVVQGCFDAAMAKIPFHQLHFYTTSETLAQQYNRLGVGEFTSLAYPVRPELFAGKSKFVDMKTSSSSAGQPIKITCPGEVRREKRGIEYLQPLVHQIWDKHLANGQVQLMIQRPKRRWPAPEKIEIHPPEDCTTDHDWVRYFLHPLDDKDYRELLHETDCGLLFYDSRVYFSRRAGVLGELLSCGKPVIVPAGSWLAGQVQDNIFDHVHSVCRERIVNSYDLGQLDWDSSNVPFAGGTVSFDQQRHPFLIRFEFESKFPGESDSHATKPSISDPAVQCETGIALQFAWHWPDEPGVYCRIQVECFGSNGELVNRSVQVVGHHRQSSTAIAYFRRLPGTKAVQIQLTNAFHDSNASVRMLKIHTVNHPDPVPLGSVGVIAADHHGIAGAIGEIVEHYQHYASSARAFAKIWRQQHDPHRTVKCLTDNQLLSRRAA